MVKLGNRVKHVLPLAVAHRGGNELAHENTLEAFQDALALGYRGIETDVHSTRHGELLAIYGQTIDGSEVIEPGGDASEHLGERAIRIADLTRADRQAIAHDCLSIPTLQKHCLWAARSIGPLTPNGQKPSHPYFPYSAGLMHSPA